MKINIGKPSGRNSIPKGLNVHENVLIVGEGLDRFDYYFPDYGLFVAVGHCDTVDRIKTESIRVEFFQDKDETYVRILDGFKGFVEKLQKTKPNFYFPKLERVQVKTWRDRKEPKPKKPVYKVRGCLVVEHKLLEPDELAERLKSPDKVVLCNINIKGQGGLGRIRLYLPEEKVIIVNKITALKKIVAKRLGLDIYTEEAYTTKFNH